MNLCLRTEKHLQPTNICLHICRYSDLVPLKLEQKWRRQASGLKQAERWFLPQTRDCTEVTGHAQAEQAMQRMQSGSQVTGASLTVARQLKGACLPCCYPSTPFHMLLMGTKQGPRSWVLGRPFITDKYMPLCALAFCFCSFLFLLAYFPSRTRLSPLPKTEDIDPPHIDRSKRTYKAAAISRLVYYPQKRPSHALPTVRPTDLPKQGRPREQSPRSQS